MCSSVYLYLNGLMLILVSVLILNLVATEVETKMKIIFGILALTAVANSYLTYNCCPSPTTTLKEACNTFTSKMFPQIVRDNSGESCVQTAFSVMFPLAQLALASEGPSHGEILRALAMPNDDTIKEEFALYTNQLENFKEIEIHLANRVFIRDGYVLKKKFKEEVRSDFMGSVKTLEFAKKSDTAKKINTYIEDQTNKRIRHVIDATDITPQTLAIIVNAAEYKGIWVHEFSEDNTHQRPFYVNPYSNTTVKMMRQTKNFKYGESSELDAKLLEMNYIDSQVKLVIILPNQYTGIEDLIIKMQDPAKLTKGLETMKDCVVSVGLPSFKIQTKTNLKIILSRMGVERLFTRGEAHLDKMIDGENDLYISTAIQKTFFEVNEEGSRAAAGSRFSVVNDDSSEADPKLFLADHPFLFYLLDEKDMILFNGVFRG